MKLPRSGLYIVYSMSNSCYQEWQADLLDFSVQASGQPGVIVRLCSREAGASDRPVSTSAFGYTLETPDYSSLGRSELMKWVPALKKRLGMKAHGRFHFYCLNKALAMQAFLDANPELDGNALLLWLDPDMVFSRAWMPGPEQVSPGKVLGQLWWGFEPNWCRENGGSKAVEYCPAGKNAIMFPFCITVHDMRRIVADYGQLSEAIYRRTRSWLSEMYGLVLAMGKAGLRCSTIEALGTCNNWPRAISDDPDTPIHHYTQAMKDRAGRPLWDKRNYTADTVSLPWKRPPSADTAARLTDRKALDMLHRFIDWQSRTPGDANPERQAR